MKLTTEQLDALRAIPVDLAPNRVSFAFAFTRSRQAEACEALGVKAPQMSLVVKGDKPVSVDIARGLAEFFGCAIEDLFPAKSEVA